MEEEDPDAEADELARDTEEQARYLVITPPARTRCRGAGGAERSPYAYYAPYPYAYYAPYCASYTHTATTRCTYSVYLLGVLTMAGCYAACTPTTRYTHYGEHVLTLPVLPTIAMPTTLPYTLWHVT